MKYVVSHASIDAVVRFSSLLSSKTKMKVLLGILTSASEFRVRHDPYTAWRKRTQDVLKPEVHLSLLPSDLCEASNGFVLPQKRRGAKIGFCLLLCELDQTEKLTILVGNASAEAIIASGILEQAKLISPQITKLSLNVVNLTSSLL